MDVLRVLCLNDKAQKILPQTKVLEIIARDHEAAENVAYNIELFAKCGPRTLKELIEHPDPQVRRGLAINFNAGASTLRALAEDPDPMVMSAARKTLRNDD